MSAPERFQVGDTVRCVDPGPAANLLTLGQVYEVTEIDNGWPVVNNGAWACIPSRFVLVSRPMSPALDLFVWDLEAFREAVRWMNLSAWDEDIVAWFWFCYWATSVNLAAHFLPTQPAARTRASNGRAVPPATVLVELPVEVAEWYAGRYNPGAGGYPTRIAQACRRAMGGGA